MRKLNILKTLVDFAFFFGVFAIATMTIFVPFTLADPDGMKVTLNGQKIVTSGIPEKILMVIALISGLFFIYSIYLLRKVIGFFMKRDLFNDKVIRHFNTIGIFLVASALLTSFSTFFFNMFRNQEVGLAVSSGGFDSFLLAVSLGLFFMVLSEVFKIAKNMKEENELTI